MTQFRHRGQSLPTQLHIIVVGAGLSGLATAISCATSFHVVKVFEAAEDLTEIGAGLQLTPNSTKILQRWGLPDWLWESGAEPGCFAIHRYSGEVLSLESGFDKSMRASFGAPFMDIRRIDLQKALYDRACELGVQFVFGERVSDIDFEHTRISTASGDEHAADLIVAADGVRSQCRASFTNEEELWHSSGDMVYRLVLELNHLSDPKLRDLISNPEVHMWIGPDSHAIGYSMKAGHGYNLGFVAKDDIPDDMHRQKCSVEEVKERFQKWDPTLTRFLDHVTTVEKWKLLQRNALSSWVSPNSNVVFVGDSCHHMLPFLAQGANTAIEDGAVLGELLGHVTDRGQLSAALSAYEELRKPRAQRIVKEAHVQREILHLVDGPTQEARDQILRSQLSRQCHGPSPIRLICSETQEWLYGYDAYKEVGESLHF